MWSNHILHVKSSYLFRISADSNIYTRFLNYGAEFWLHLWSRSGCVLVTCGPRRPTSPRLMAFLLPRRCKLCQHKQLGTRSGHDKFKWGQKGKKENTVQTGRIFFFYCLKAPCGPQCCTNRSSLSLSLSVFNGLWQGFRSSELHMGAILAHFVH